MGLSCQLGKPRRVLRNGLYVGYENVFHASSWLVCFQVLAVTFFSSVGVEG